MTYGNKVRMTLWLRGANLQEFYLKLECPIQQAVLRYYVDTNIQQNISGNIVVSLDQSATTPNTWEITNSCLAMNIPALWRVIQDTHKQLMSKGMLKIVLAMYSKTNEKPAS